jgi:hypothetical protein
MSPNTLRLRSFFLNQAKARTSQGIALTTTVLLALSSVAQQQSPPPTKDSPDNSTSTVTAGSATASVAAGTRLALVLTQPIQTRYVRRGDDIYAQIVSPVTSGNEVVIPPGTFVQGKIDKLERHGGRGELRLQSMAITFPDGYVASISGPVTLESDDGYAIKDPGKGRIAGAFALPAAGLGLGALIGHAVSPQPETITSTLPAGCTGPPPFCLTSSLPSSANTLKSTAIGSMIGLAVGGVASLAIVLNTHNFYLDIGSPISMVLHQPLSLPEDEVADAIRDAEQHPGPDQAAAQQPQLTPPDNMKIGPTICETPGTPATPAADTPGTAATADSPGTQVTHLPGIPATPPSTHTCP